MSQDGQVHRSATAVLALFVDSLHGWSRPRDIRQLARVEGVLGLSGPSRNLILPTHLSKTEWSDLNLRHIRDPSVLSEIAALGNPG
jgi:hypothetical protein